MFDSPAALRTAHLGLFWQGIRAEFPNTVEQPPLDSPREIENEKRAPVEPTLRFESVATPPIRLWFLTESGNELLQLQKDRLAHNWRRGKAAAYPSYENIRAPFERHLHGFDQFLIEQRIGRLNPTQVEVSYVNHVKPGVWSSHAELDRVLRNWSNPSGDFLRGLEDARLSWRYVIRDSDMFLGRLHVSVQPAYSVSEPIFLLTLTARGNPTGDGIDGALRFLDIGHEWIVRGFVDLTTPEMHATWGRQQ